MTAISVIVPVYNVEKYLNRCLDSILFQRFKDIEVICINDGSTDNSDYILTRYAKKDKRIKIISQANYGLSSARNIGLSYASGESIFFLDGDDAIHPDCLISLWHILNDSKADFVHCQFEKSDGISRRYYDIDEKEIKYRLVSSYCFMCSKNMGFQVWSNLYRKELLEGIRFIDGIHFEDVPFLLMVLARRPKIALLNEKMYFYTFNENSISNKQAHPKQIQDYHRGLQHVYEVYSERDMLSELKCLKRTIIPTILKQQLGRCRRSEKRVRQDMYQVFAAELKDLQEKGLLEWRGHKLSRYLTYQRLIKENS